MPQPIEHLLSSEDAHHLETHRLGRPLAIYRISSVYINIYRFFSVFLVIMGIFALAFVLTRWYIKETELVIVAAMTVLSLSVGPYVLRIELPRVQRIHLIICERGFLQIGERDIDAVRWQDVLAIKKWYNEYSITRRGDKPISVTVLYWHVKELVTVIRQRSGIV